MRPCRWLRRTAVLAAAATLAGCGAGPFQPTHTGVVPLGGDAAAGQTFRPASARVGRVDLLVATYGRAADPDGVLAVTLRAGAGGEVLARARVPGSALEDNTWVAVPFEGAPVVAGDRAAFEVRWQGAEPVALRANVPPAEVGEDRLLNDPYPGGELLRDGEPAAGDLAFRVAGEGGTVAAAAGVARLARGAGARLLAQPVFAAAWLLLLAAAVALAVRGLRARPAP